MNERKKEINNGEMEYESEVKLKWEKEKSCLFQENKAEI